MHKNLLNPPKRSQRYTIEGQQGFWNYGQYYRGCYSFFQRHGEHVVRVHILKKELHEKVKPVVVQVEATLRYVNQKILMSSI